MKEATPEVVITVTNGTTVNNVIASTANQVFIFTNTSYNAIVS
jgi:hypothetical protein